MSLEQMKAKLIGKYVVVDDVQLAAVRKDGYAIQFIKNPSEAVQLVAVRKDGYAITYIDNPSEVAKERVLSLAFDDIDLYNTISKLDWFKEL